MKSNILSIKNMVCLRCIMAVQEILAHLKISYKRISLGEVELERPLSNRELQNIEQDFKKVGFEIFVKKLKRSSTK